nr:hypothetical protein BaRGS_003185 [Batillaria attramentaria]
MYWLLSDGEELLVHILQDEEELNFDAVWDVIDAFKESVLLTRERDVELEAMGYSALGRVFHKGEILMAEEAEKRRQHDVVMEEIKEDVDKLEKEFRRGSKAGMTMGTLQAIIGNNFRLSLEHFSIAWHEGSSQTVEWLDSLVAASLGCWADLRQRVDEWEYGRRIRELEKTDISIQTCVAESIKAREKGEELLAHVLLDEEDLNIDAVWTVVDAFKESAMLTREHDIELEAMAYSALGRVYHKVLKLKDYAKRYLTRALQLASSMMPRNFSGVEWFEFAQETVKSYQLENVREEEAERHRQRETVMGEIKEDLDKLSKKYHESGRMEFLEYVYKNYPPKNKLHKLGEVPSAPDMNQVKKLYQKAVTHYHPDKVTEEEHGKQWKVLTEEITKFLTRTYESFKGC